MSRHQLARGAIDRHRECLIDPMNQDSAQIDSITVSCLVLIDSAARLLATQRPADKPLGGLWEFPGGKVEPQESDETDLRREIREELQFEIGALSPLTPVTHAYDFALVTLIPFLSRCESLQPVYGPALAADASQHQARASVATR